MFYFYSGNHSNYTGISCFTIFMPKISSGGQFIFTEVMLWSVAKSTDANTKCNFYLFSLGMQSQLQWVFFQVVFFQQNYWTAWQHCELWSEFSAAAPLLKSTELCWQRTWFFIVSRHTTLTVTSLWHSQNYKVFGWEDLAADWKHWWLSAQCSVFWVKNDLVSWHCSLEFGFLVVFMRCKPLCFVKLLHFTFWKGKLIFLLLFFFNIKIATVGCLFLQSW